MEVERATLKIGWSLNEIGGICFFPSSAPRLMIPDREHRFLLPFVLSIFVAGFERGGDFLGIGGFNLHRGEQLEGRPEEAGQEQYPDHRIGPEADRVRLDPVVVIGRG